MSNKGHGDAIKFFSSLELGKEIWRRRSYLGIDERSRYFTPVYIAIGQYIHHRRAERLPFALSGSKMYAILRTHLTGAAFPQRIANKAIVGLFRNVTTRSDTSSVVSFSMGDADFV